MQDRLNFTEQKYISLPDKITIDNLLKSTRKYLNRLTKAKSVIKATIEILEENVELEEVVERLNNADKKLAGKEYTNFIRTFFIPQLTFYALSEEAGVSKRSWDNPVENGLLKE